MLFDGPPPELPIATLRPTVHGRRRAILVDLERWLADRAAWLRPRAVPLLVAFASLFVTLGAIKAVGLWAHREPLALTLHARVTDQPLQDGDGPMWRCRGQVGHVARARPVRIVIQPLNPGDHYTELTISTPDGTLDGTLDRR